MPAAAPVSDVSSDEAAQVAADVPGTTAAALAHRHVLGMRVDHLEAAVAARQIGEWAAAVRPGRAASPGRYVCAANVHMTMTAHDDAAFRAVVNGAALVVPDGQPMVWALRALGLRQRARVRVAPDLLIELFAACSARGLKLGLYGGTPETLRDFVDHLGDRHPKLHVAYAWSPPFRPLTKAEDDAVVREVGAAGVQLLLVGIGCPKQERWMAAHVDRLGCVMIGVGAAFDMLAGRTGDAPEWMRGRGLEWVYRLGQEPRRLWRRYLIQNPRFVAHFAAQVVRERLPRCG
jgi:N-acetylglucosaminyldiphosphoundecaprenol N-acetyl-beta-D-mannosaminyltransferase